MKKNLCLFDIEGRKLICILALVLIILPLDVISQPSDINWSPDGNAYYMLSQNQIIKYSLPGNTPATLISMEQLIPSGGTNALKLNYYRIDENLGKALLMTNAKKVWRLKTRGDFWVLDLKTGNLSQIGRFN